MPCRFLALFACCSLTFLLTGCEPSVGEVGETTSKTELEQYLEDNPDAANATMAELDE
jgi:hypothetical protein